MKIRIDIDDTEHTVDIVKEEKGTYLCLVDGRDVVVDVSRIRHNDVSVYSLLSHGRSYDVVFHKNKSLNTVSVNGHNFSVTIRNESGVMKGKDRKLHEDQALFKIAATIPGKIVAVKVEKGITVKKGQPLIVIEAMKMENELKSPADGMVTGVYVKTGDKVENNAALLEIDTRIPL